VQATTSSPFGPGASGNTASEDILFATKPDWLTTERLARIVELGEDLTARLGERNASKAAQGARSTAHAFPWVISGT
ncbi:hydroxymethylglutaryl-CoA lyase, partial [Nocardia zapadnayensis]|nr:hydroxymethylglutaryl-CoA lyase [Nocardia zapadnayensis]